MCLTIAENSNSELYSTNTLLWLNNLFVFLIKCNRAEYHKNVNVRTNLLLTLNIIYVMFIADISLFLKLAKGHGTCKDGRKRTTCIITTHLLNYEPCRRVFVKAGILLLMSEAFTAQRRLFKYEPNSKRMARGGGVTCFAFIAWLS